VSALKTAAAVAALLAGIVTGLYVLGGLVIGLRLFFDHFNSTTVGTIVGELPREHVVATALTNLLAPATVVAFLVALVYWMFRGPRPEPTHTDHARGWWAKHRTAHRRWAQGRRPLLLLGLILLPVLLLAPAAYEIHSHDGSALIWRTLAGLAIMYPVVFAWRYQKGRLGRSGWPRILRALAAGGLFGAMALVPILLFTTALPFAPAQACTPNSRVPVKGRLIAEGGDRVLLEEHFGREAAVVTLPTDRVTVSEYGDLSSRFVCPASPGEKAAAKLAETRLERHGSPREREMAAKLRPRLRFDSRERWRPIAVDTFLAERFLDGSGHSICKSIAGCTPIRSPAGLRTRPGEEPGYIDIHGATKNGADFASADPRCRARAPALDCNWGPGAAIYYRRTSHEALWYWDYWWFFRYNDYNRIGGDCNAVLCGDHEGDWEGITVVTTATDPPHLVGAIYAAHNDRVYIEGPLVPRAGNHALVFVAEGTHAAYPFHCEEDCRQYATVLSGHLPEGPHDGAIPWGGNENADCAENRCVRPMPEIGRPGQRALPLAGGWAGWLGQWGETCHEGCSSHLELQASPRSPGTQIRFQCPWAVTGIALPATDGSGLKRAEAAGDAERLKAVCGAQRGGL
jgi:hypothetical protein